MQNNQVLFNKLDSICFKDIKEKNRGEALHNRYVITELSAISLGIGLDETNENEKDDVNLLAEESYQLRYSQYVELLAFDLIDQAGNDT